MQSIHLRKRLSNFSKFAANTLDFKNFATIQSVN